MSLRKCQYISDEYPRKAQTGTNRLYSCLIRVAVQLDLGSPTGSRTIPALGRTPEAFEEFNSACGSCRRKDNGEVRYPQLHAFF